MTQILLNNRNLMDLIKDNMLQEKRWNAEITQLLKGQIIHLKSEITHKNMLIENMMIE